MGEWKYRVTQIVLLIISYLLARFLTEPLGIAQHNLFFIFTLIAIAGSWIIKKKQDSKVVSETG